MFSKKLVKMFSTFFYIGEFPVAPGTMASAAGALLAIILYGHPFLYLILFAVVTYIGFKVSHEMELLVNKKDPGCVVIDEVSGILISFFGLKLSWPVIFTAFFLFRAFDMFKIYPGNIMESKGGSFGIMMDDIVAGIYTNVIMHVAIAWAGI